MAAWDVTSDADVRAAVRAETQYDDNPDELPQAELDVLLARAKHRVSLETGSTDWYTDSGMGLVLVAYTCMRAKAAIENASIISYSLGDESVQLRNADPDTNQQIQQWADDVRVGLDASTVDSSSRLKPRNTSGYIGETYIE